MLATIFASPGLQSNIVRDKRMSVSICAASSKLHVTGRFGTHPGNCIHDPQTGFLPLTPGRPAWQAALIACAPVSCPFAAPRRAAPVAAEAGA